MTEWSYLLFSGSIYALGFLGLFAFTLLPLRAFLVVWRNLHLWHATDIYKIALLLVSVVAVTALTLSIFPATQVFRCLTETYCGPNRAHGWFHLAFIGVLYLGFETLSNITLAFARRASRVAT